MIAEYASPYNITPTQDGGIALVNKRTGRVVFMLSAMEIDVTIRPDETPQAFVVFRCSEPKEAKS